jgi:hypothetical protein
MSLSKQRLRFVSRHLGFVAIACGLIVFARTWPIHTTSVPWVLAPVAVVAVGVRLLRFGWTFRTIDYPLHADPGAVSVAESAPTNLNSTELQAATLLFGKSAWFCERLTHEIVPKGDYLENCVSRVINIRDIPFGDSDRIIIPILFPERGHLVDNLRIEDLTGQGFGTICNSTTASLLVYQALCLMTLDAYQRADDEILNILERLRATVTADQTMAHGEVARTRFVGALDDLAQLPRPNSLMGEGHVKPSEILRLWAANLTGYVVFAVFDQSNLASDRLVFSVKYSKPISEVRGAPVDDQPDVDYGDPGRRRWKERLRGTFGVQPWIYRFPLGYERTTRSYNLRFVTADDQYVLRLSVQRRHADGTLASDPGHLAATRNSSAHTMPFVHLYLRPLADVIARGELRVRIAMREKPPGVLGLVALIGIAQVLLIVTTLAFYNRIFSQTGFRSTSSDVAALLQASPGLVYAWLANQLAPGRLARVPLSAIGGIALNGFGALFAAMLAMLSASGVDPLCFDIDGIAIAHSLWIILIIVLIWGVGNQVMRWRANTVAFMAREVAQPVLSRFVV